MASGGRREKIEKRASSVSFFYLQVVDSEIFLTGRERHVNGHLSWLVQFKFPKHSQH